MLFITPLISEGLGPWQVFTFQKKKKKQNYQYGHSELQTKSKRNKNVRTHKYVGGAHNVQRGGAAVDNGVVGPAEASKGQLTFE